MARNARVAHNTPVDKRACVALSAGRQTSRALINVNVNTKRSTMRVFGNPELTACLLYCICLCLCLGPLWNHYSTFLVTGCDVNSSVFTVTFFAFIVIPSFSFFRRFAMYLRFDSRTDSASRMSRYF